MVEITGVEGGSLAEVHGVRPGDFLLALNGHEIRDVLDYKFYLADGRVALKLRRGADIIGRVIEKGQYDDIGLEFGSYLMDGKRDCANACIFCFVDQMPKGCRASLYFKDDDERLSFLHGNYITLTNLDGGHIERIIKFKLSPVNISVHTTSPELRVKLMRNDRAGEVLEYISRLDAAGIKINAQIVLCKGVNDGAELERTLSDLCALESVISVAVVPAGLTKHRDGLHKLESFSKADCARVIDLVDGFDGAYCADEFYLQAGRDLPCESYYGDYPQYENGVGMIRSFSEEFNAAAEGAVLRAPRKVSVATGTAAHALISACAGVLEKRHADLECRVYAIKNEFLGERVTVAGLVAGGDIIAQLKGHDLGGELIIPAVMLRHGRDLFIDDVSVGDVERELGVKLTVAEANGEDFVSKVLGV